MIQKHKTLMKIMGVPFDNYLTIKLFTDEMKNIYLLYLLGILICFGACEKNKFEISSCADEFLFLRNDGADLPVWVKGNTASKTMIVYLHGGPVGKGALGDWAFINSDFFKSVTQDFAMVLFDQRGTGSSQGHYSKDLLNEEQFVEDLNKLINLLYNKYGTDINVFLYGVSWGGYLGNAYLTSNDYQNKIKGWINDCGSHNILLDANSGKQMLIFYAKQQINLNKNIEDWSEILSWCKSKDTIIELDDFAKTYKYIDFAGRLMNDSTNNSISWDKKAVNKLKYNSPYSGSSVLSNSLFNYYIAENYKKLNLTDKMYRINIPTLLVRGRYDFGVTEEVINDAFSRISSDVKYKVTFEKSGHAVWSFETEEFTRLFKEFIVDNI
jgi:proline iminopeptidase